jgi:predicted ATPase
MAQIAKTSEFIGRGKALTELSKMLESAEQMEGQTAFIYGEAGIGKTRLINELRKTAVGKKFQWLSARCIYHEGTDPYLPFYDALKGSKCSPFSKGDEAQIPKTEKVVSDKSGSVDISTIPVIGKKLTEDPSMPFDSFLIKESKSDNSFEVFSALIDRGYKGLCITRIPPDKLENISRSTGTEILWLSKKSGKTCIPPSLVKLSHEIMSFAKKNQNSVILLDGLEYVIGNVEFNKVLRFVNEIVDSTALNKSIFIMPMNPLAIDKKHLALIERDMTTIDLTSPASFIETTAQKEGREIGKHTIDEEEFRQGRFRLFEMFTQQLLDIASVKPVVLFIDDIHWADVGALNLLYYLSRAVANYPIAIVGAYRPEDLADPAEPHPLQNLLNRMILEKILKQIFLDRFNQDETSEMIGSLLGTNNYPNKLVEFIYKETEGSPLFIEEVLRSMEEELIISYSKDGDSWELTKKIPEIKIPETIKDVVHIRTDRLNKKMRHVLESASVLGVEFEYDMLTAVLAMNEDQLITYLDDLVHMRLLTELPAKMGQPVCYRFAHNKICEVLYEGLGQVRRRHLHTRTAEAIEKRHKDNLDNYIYELAEHYHQGGDYRRSLHYTMVAGEKALDGFAPEKARAFYLRALNSIELMVTRPSENIANKMQQSEILMKLTEISIVVGEWDEALKYTNNLLNLSKELEDQWKQVSANIYRGQIHYMRSSWAESLTHFNSALMLAEESKYQPGMMEAYYWIGTVHEKMGEYAKAMEYFQQFMELAFPLDSPGEIARGYKAFATISFHRGDYNTALEYYNKCIELLSDTNNFYELAKAYTYMGVTYYELAELDKVIEWNEKCVELSGRTGDIRLRGYGYSNAAEAYACINDLDRAQDYADKAFEIFTKLDEKPMIGLVLMNFGIINKLKKDWKTARQQFEKSLELLKEANVPSYIADSTRQFGLLLAAQGSKESIAESRKYLKEAQKKYQELGKEKYVNTIKNELEALPK